MFGPEFRSEFGLETPNWNLTKLKVEAQNYVFEYKPNLRLKELP